MRVTKIKCLSKGTTVLYETVNINSPEGHDLTDCPDKRGDDFEEALAACQEDALGFLGQAKGKWGMTGVDVKRLRNGSRTVQYTGKLITPHGEVATNTVLMRIPVDGGEGENTLSDLAVKRLDALLDQAAAFVAGEREQGELPLGAGHSDHALDQGEQEADDQAAVN